MRAWQRTRKACIFSVSIKSLALVHARVYSPSSQPSQFPTHSGPSRTAAIRSEGNAGFRPRCTLAESYWQRPDYRPHWPQVRHLVGAHCLLVPRAAAVGPNLLLVVAAVVVAFHRD